MPSPTIVNAELAPGSIVEEKAMHHVSLFRVRFGPTVTTPMTDGSSPVVQHSPVPVSGTRLGCLRHRRGSSGRAACALDSTL